MFIWFYSDVLLTTSGLHKSWEPGCPGDKMLHSGIFSIELSVTILARIISRRFLDVWEIFGHLYYIDYFM